MRITIFLSIVKYIIVFFFLIFWQDWKEVEAGLWHISLKFYDCWEFSSLNFIFSIFIFIKKKRFDEIFDDKNQE